MVDQTKVKEAVRMLLEGIGEDVNREGLRETPERIARMYEQIFAGMEGPIWNPFSPPHTRKRHCAIAEVTL